MVLDSIVRFLVVEIQITWCCANSIASLTLNVANTIELRINVSEVKRQSFSNNFDTVA